MKKKSDKVAILLLILVGCALLAWFVPQGSFENGTYVGSTVVRPGITDIFADICLGLYSAFTDIAFLLIIGGCYGVLSKTKAYRKLLDKVSGLIDGKEIIALVCTVFLVSIITSFVNYVYLMFIFVPFIASVFMRKGYDRMTAFLATFGAMLVGFMGQTYGSYAMDYLRDSTALEVSSLIGVKFAIYVVTLVIYCLFAVLYMKKDGQKDEVEYDLYETEELDESKVKSKRKTKLWPLLLVFGIAFVIILLGHINWYDSFGIEAFKNGFSSFKNSFKIANIPFFSSLLGTEFTAFGTWEQPLLAALFFFFATCIMAWIEKMKFGDFALRFEVGLKKIVRLVIVFGLIMGIFALNRKFNWSATFIKDLFGGGSFNVFTLIVISFVITLLTVHIGMTNYTYGYYLTVTPAFVDKLAYSALLLHIGEGFAMFLAPTSMMLFVGLTYYDISYKNYLKYIWKFALTLFLAILLMMAIIIYM